MSLTEALNRVRGIVQNAVPASIFEAIGASIADLHASGIAKTAAGIGAEVSLPVLDSVEGRSIDLNATAAGRPVVLVFYRGGWCPYCNVALQAYAKALPEIEAAGGVLIAITPESPERAAETTRNNDVLFPVVIDRGNGFARSLGVVFSLPDDLRPLYRDIGIDLPAHNGDDSHELPIPAVYVLDRSGRVVWAHVEADFTTRAEPAEVVAALQALKSPTAHSSSQAA